MKKKKKTLKQISNKRRYKGKVKFKFNKINLQLFSLLNNLFNLIFLKIEEISISFIKI